MWRLTERMVRSGLVIGLALGDLADEHLAVLGERDDRRGGAGALGVGDDDGLAGLEHATTELVVPRSIPTALGIERTGP
jgi:hypothetical protein